jgi:hypothetical protein
MPQAHVAVRAAGCQQGRAVLTADRGHRPYLPGMASQRFTGRTTGSRVPERHPMIRTGRGEQVRIAPGIGSGHIDQIQLPGSVASLPRLNPSARSTSVIWPSWQLTGADWPQESRRGDISHQSFGGKVTMFRF